MIIAGPCLMTSLEEENDILKTAHGLIGVADYFRCKLWGGGPSLDKFNPGIREGGVRVLEKINDILPAGTECQTPGQCQLAGHLSFWWIGARSAQNYGLLEYACRYSKTLMVKRGMAMTIDETIGLFDVCKHKYGKEIYIIERGEVTFDRLPASRWSPDLKGVIRLKHERPDVFERTIIDCSHSTFNHDWVDDVYKAFKAIGCNNFMFECTHDGKSKTDQAHMLSVEELKSILRG